MTAIAKGMITQALLNCAATAALGEAAGTILKLVGITQDTASFIEAVKSGDPEKIIVESLRLVVSLYTLQCQCFTGDTLVSTVEGSRRIDEVEAGDIVWSYDTETGENVKAKVTNVSVTETDTLIHVFTSDGEELRTTMFHPFYVKGTNTDENGWEEVTLTGEWKADSNLQAGDELLSEDGRIISVTEVRIERLVEKIKVYNLEIEELHTYYVGNGVLVHNKCQVVDETGGDSKLQEASDVADNYTLSEDVFEKHILTRHSSDSMYKNKSHFNSDYDIKNGIESTLKGNNFIIKPNTGGRAGYIFEQTFSKPIGIDSKGKPLYTIKVVIDERGNVVTAFPKK